MGDLTSERVEASLRERGSGPGQRLAGLRPAAQRSEGANSDEPTYWDSQAYQVLALYISTLGTYLRCRVGFIRLAKWALSGPAHQYRATNLSGPSRAVWCPV